ncbi:mucin-binding protein [Lactiplantibacillus plantarum]
MEEKKLHYKMYKDGKKFVFAAIATLSFFVSGGVSTEAVHADTTSGNLTAATVNSTSDTKSAVSSAATVASSDSDTKSAAQSAATVASSDSDTKSVVQSAATVASSDSDTKSVVQSAATVASSDSDTKSAAQSAATVASSDSDTKSVVQSAATVASSASDTKSAAQSAATAVSSDSDTKSAAQSSATSTSSSAVRAETTSASELSTQKDDVNSNTQQNMAIKTLSNLTDTDKNGIQTNWSRDKSADTGNSDSNSVSNEAGKYWPNTQGDSLKDYSKTAITDFTKDQTFDLGYNPTPSLHNSSDLSLYIRGQRVDLSNLVDDDSLNGSAQYTGHNSKGHSRLISTSDLGENTYFWAKNVFKIYNEITHKYDRYDLKWTLESVNYGDANTQIALGIKGSQDSGGTQLLNIGSGWQLAHLGNFFNTHLQFFKEENESASNENPALAIANADVTAAAVSIHMGFSDIDNNEAVQLTSGVIKKVYVDSATQLAYQDHDGYLSVTRKYNDSSDVSGKNESKVTFLMEMDVPVEGFDLSVATIGNQKDSSNNYIHGQGSKVAPSLLSTMKYTEPLVIVYNKLDGNGNTTTESLQSPKMFEGLIGDKYTVDSTGNKVDTSAPSTITDSDGNIWKLVSEKTQGNPNGSYVDGTNEIDYYYQISKGTITTHYIDENGHEIKEDTNSTGNVGNNYTTTAEPTITGSNGQTYYLDTKKTPANAAGKYTDGNTDVTYTYYEKGTVVTKYTDEEGNPLQNPTFTTDKEGNSFTTTAPESIVKDGVTYVLTAQPTNATGEYTNGETDVTYVYAPLTETLVIVNETINYIDQSGNSLPNIDSHQATPITFITVTNPVTKETTTYYKNGTQKQPTLDVDGQPDSTWTESNEANFQAVTNPTVPGYHVIKTTDPTNDLTQTTSKTVDITNGNLNYTVTYTPNAEKANVTYIDDTTGKTLSAKDLTGDYGSTDPYRTGDTIADYEKQGYQLVSDNYPTNGVVYNQDGTVQSFEVHLTHGTTPVGSNNPQTPGEPINPDNPDGPKWPEGTDKSSVTQTVIRTVNYLDKQTGKVVAKQITEQVTYNRTAIVDKVTGQIIGYSTTGGDTVDQTDGDKAWTAVDNKSDWDSVTSPDLSYKGYLAPDLATVAQQTVTPGDKDVTVNVYYDHDVVPVNPTNPQTPGMPINPDDPDSPKWPAGTDKNSLTTDVHQTIHYQYGDGSQAAPDKTDSTTFNHQVEIDKVTGEIVKDDGWTAENGKTSFDSKNSPVIPGYTASKPASDSVDGLTQDSKDNVQTIIYTANQEAANVTYIDDTTGKTLSAKDLTGDYGSTDPYRTGDTIADYEKQGYQLVSDNYPTNGVVYNQDGTVQSFEVHLTHGTTPVGSNNPQTPGEPINPDNPDGPKWPEGTDKSSVTQTVIRTVNYLDKQTGKVVAKQITEQVTYNRTAIVDKVTGQIIGYSTTGGDTVDQTDGDKAWTAVDNKSDWDSVTSPDLSYKGYLAPDLATVAQQTVTPGDKDVTVNVYYDHDVVPVNPTNPQTPGMPINPDDPDSPKWPAGTDKNSLTTDVHQTIHYQYGDGSQAAPDKTDSTTFNHQVEIDKVTGEIVKDDGWTAENGKTSFDSKNSPVIPGYTASKPASDSVDGLTQDSKDNVQTIIYTANQEAANVTYIDDTTGKTLSAKDLTGDYGSTDPYRTGDTIADYEKQGYQLVSDNYPTNGVVYNQDGTVQSFEVHLTHGTTQTSESQTVNETIHYVYKNGDKAADDYQATPLNFTRTVTTDKVTGEKTYGSWSADQSFAAVTSPAIKGYTADKAQIDKQTVNGDSKDLEFKVTYTKNAPTITTEKKTVNETIHYVYKDGSKAVDDHVAKPVEFTRQVSTDAVTGEKTYGSWSADQSFAAVTSPAIKGYTADKAQIDKQTVNGDSKDLEFKVTYTKNAPTITTESKTINETIHYVYKDGSKAVDDHVAKPVEFTRQVSTDAVTGEKTYGSWSADQSFAAVTSPELKGYTADKAQIDKQTVNGDSKDLEFKVTYTKNAPTITTESKTINETIHYVYKDGTTAHDDYVAKPVEFTREVSTDAVTGEKTYGSWSADQSFAAVTSPAIKGYTADKAQIDKQTVNGDSKDLEFKVTYTKNAPTITTESKTINETIHYVYKDGTTAHDDYVAKPVEFTREVSTDAVTGEKTYGSWSADQSFDAVTSPELKGYTADKAQIDKQTVTGDSKDLEFTVTYKADNNGGTGLNQPGKPGNGTDTGNPSSNQPGNPSQPSNATNNGVINTSTNTGSKVNNGAVNSPELPQTGENNSQSQTMSFIGILLVMFGSSLGFLGIKKRRND